MAIQLTTNFDANHNRPSFSYQQKDDIAGRDAIIFRFEGMKVYVKDDGTGNPKNYQLQGGVANTDWVDISAGGGSSEAPLVQLNIIAARDTVEVPAGGMVEKIVFKNRTIGATGMLDIGTSAGGSQIAEEYQVDYGWNILQFNAIYESSQVIYLSGNFDSGTYDLYVTYKQLI